MVRKFSLFFALLGVASFLSAATITVQVRDAAGAAVVGAKVCFVGVPEGSLTGDPDPDEINLLFTGSNGDAMLLDAATGYNYIVAVSKDKWGPTISEQVDDPVLRHIRVRGTADNITIRRVLNPLPAERRVGTLRVVLNNIPLPDGRVAVADIQRAETDANAAMGFAHVLSNSATIYAHNVPVALTKDAYRAFIAVADGVNTKGLDVIVSTSILANVVRTINVDFSQAVNIMRVEREEEIHAEPAFSGVVRSTDGAAIAGARVILFRHHPGRPAGDFSGAENAYQTFSDPAGNFVFYNVLPGTYAVQINAVGYMSKWDARWGGYRFSGSPIRLEPAVLELGLGRISGRVLVWDENGRWHRPVPNARVYAHGIWDSWQAIPDDIHDNYYTTGWLRGGRGWASAITDHHGAFELTGLGAGNFDISVWSDMHPGESHRFSAGDNKRVEFDTASGARSGDDLRVQIASDTFNWSVWRADGTRPHGELVNPRIELVISTLTARVGKISGTISFRDFEKYPDRAWFDPDNPQLGYSVRITEPVVVYAWEDSHDWRNRRVYNFTYEEGSMAFGPVLYDIDVATGTSYWLGVESTKWAVLNQEDMRSDLSISSHVANKNFILVPAGSARVIVKDPSGNVIRRITKLQPGTTDRWLSTGVEVRFHGPTHWSSEIGDQGEDIVHGLVPGVYRVSAEHYSRSYREGGSDMIVQNVYPVSVAENINISADRTTTIEITLRPALKVSPSGSAAAMPPLPAGAKGFYVAAGFESGQTVTAEVLSETLFAAGGEDIRNPAQVGFVYKQGRWETKPVPDGKYDFYLGYVNVYNAGGDNDMPVNFRQSFTVFTTISGHDVEYDPLKPGATSYLNFGSGTLGNAVITGELRGSKLFTPADIEKIRTAGFDRMFFRYIPTVMIYDQLGALKGFSAAMPREDRMRTVWIPRAVEQGLESLLNYDWISNELRNHPFEFWCEKLPAGKYILVFNHPNYPPIMRQVLLTSGTNTINVDLDRAETVGTGVYGVVRSTMGVPIEGANVTVKNRNANIEKYTTTDSSGAFSVVGIPPGVYIVDVSRGDYAPGGEKVSIGRDIRNAGVIELKIADASISGTVFAQRMPAVLLPGVRIIAYNETESGRNPRRYLPVSRAVTDINGSYFIPGLISGDTYRIYCIADGRVLEWRTLQISKGRNEQIDFTPIPSRPRLKVNTKRLLENRRIFYHFLIEVPGKLVNMHNPELPAAPRCRYSPVSSPEMPFDEAKSVELLVEPGPNNTYSMTFSPTTEDRYFKMRIEATDGVNDYYEDILFGPMIEARVKKDITSELAEGGLVSIDAAGGDTTKIGLDPGALTPTDVQETKEQRWEGGATVDVPIGGFLSALPSFQLSKTQSARDVAMQRITEDVVASDVYEVDLSVAQLNKDITLTLNYDRSKVITESDLSELRIGRFNASTNEWEMLQGVITPDPVAGTVSIEIGSIGGTNANPLPRAKFDGRKFSVNRAAPTSQRGVFAVFRQDPNTAVAYAGTEFVMYNFPNPFDLKNKTVRLSNSNVAEASITGTLIMYALPANKGGNVKLYIYNLAGELVRTIDEGTKVGGRYWYTEWDGKNDNGKECASGVYFLIAERDGEKLNAEPLKIAILK